MARRRYRRFRRRSGRWAPNIVKISSTNIATQGEFSNTEDLASNPLQSNTGVAQAFTVKNFEITFTIEGENYRSRDYLESITAYIMYVPQGMNVTSSYYAEHPEYIMAYKYLGQPSAARLNAIPEQIIEDQQYQPIRIKTRLSRKLQTGDKVILYIQGSNQYTANVNYNINGIVRWWSKAN